jgi:pre-mRNA cleavage complex 2 protein Pcf11
LPAHAIQPSEAVIKTEEAKKAAAATAEILNKFVPVPASAATDEEIRHCPICKEEFKNEYSEEEEDWIWRNAVEIDGRIYHASCKAEQAE